jgi:hypothetical protein
MFALMHKPTGTFMPSPVGRGGTYVDPFAKRRRQKTTPRLFARKQDAASALDWWLKGKVQMGNVGPWDEGYPDREITGYLPVPSRIADEWSVVEVSLQVTYV